MFRERSSARVPSPSGPTDFGVYSRKRITLEEGSTHHGRPDLYNRCIEISSALHPAPGGRWHDAVLVEAELLGCGRYQILRSKAGKRPRRVRGISVTFLLPYKLGAGTCIRTAPV